MIGILHVTIDLRECLKLKINYGDPFLVEFIDDISTEDYDILSAKWWIYPSELLFATGLDITYEQMR
jgi:hypothetical protein